MEQEEMWRAKRVRGYGPEPECAPAACNTTWDERKLGPRPQHVGPRAQRMEDGEKLYKWDEVELDPAATTLLFDLFVVVGLKSAEPVVYYRYDAHEGADKTQAKLYGQIQHFCYPNTAQQPRKTMRPEMFTFVLTDPQGGRRIGFCRRALPTGSGPRYPEVLCIVSRFPWFSLFAKVLSTLADRTPRQAMRFLRAVRDQPVPLAGQRISVPALSADGGEGAAAGPGAMVEMVHLVRPDDHDTPFSDVNFVPLFARMSTPNIVLLFGALLSERRVLLTSSKLSRLSACCHAAAALLYPFRWQHVFIPILPEKMIHLTTAPMPYLMGVHTGLTPELMRMPLNNEPPLMVDLDANQIYEWGCKGNEPIGSGAWQEPQLSEHVGPAPEMQPLLFMLRRHPLLQFATSEPTALHTVVSETFRALFLALFGRYRLFITGHGEGRDDKPGDVEWHNETHFFHHNAFAESLSPSFACFFTEFFMRTQLFDVFIGDRLDNAQQGYPANKGIFEREVAELLGNIEMFGDAAPGPFSSEALPASQTFRRALGCRHA